MLNVYQLLSSLGTDENCELSDLVRLHGWLSLIFVCLAKQKRKKSNTKQDRK
jgi:hypothetical protein